MTRVAMVVQRYGEDIVGGAESLVRQISTKLSIEKNWHIDIYTTTARDYHTWTHSFKEGEETNDRITIKRFRVRFSRHKLIFAAANLLFSPALRYLGRKSLPSWINAIRDYVEQLWFIVQGPYCPNLCANLRVNRKKYKKIYFYTYLYYPTINAFEDLTDQAVLVPFAHDEPPFYFKSIARLFLNANQILVNCDAEKELIMSTYKTSEEKFSQAGVGIDDLVPEGLETANLANPISDPFLLFMGRVSNSKGVNILIEHFICYKGEHKNSTHKLILAGQIDPKFIVGSHQDVVFLGHVSERQKINLLKTCTAVVNPSNFESLSMLVLEAICCKKPVLVNGHNPVLSSYTRHTKTVEAYYDYDSFASSLNVILSDGDSKKRTSALDSSSAWVLDTYSWDRVMKSYENSLQSP